VTASDSISERFWSKVQISDGCWLWTDSNSHSGYGVLFPFHKQPKRYAHRLAWELFVGPIPTGKCVLHTCDVRTCVNPDHLFVGTKGQNIMDAILKGRNPHFGVWNYCRKGHALTGGNVKLKTGRHGIERRCVICALENSRARPNRNEYQREFRRRKRVESANG
jgi:hypothetical protein